MPLQPYSHLGDILLPVNAGAAVQCLTADSQLCGTLCGAPRLVAHRALAQAGSGVGDQSMAGASAWQEDACIAYFLSLEVRASHSFHFLGTTRSVLPPASMIHQHIGMPSGVIQAIIVLVRSRDTVASIMSG